MKFLPLIWKSLWRRKVRTVFTLLSIFVAFLLFGLLMTIRAAFTLGVDIAGNDRLMVVNKISLIMPLPSSYQRRPISPPPRTWAIAKPMPRSSSESREMVKKGSTECS